VLVAAVAVQVTAAGGSVGTRLPALRATALEGASVVLPDSAAGRVTLIGFGLKRQVHGQIEKWLDAYESEFSDRARYDCYEVPLMGGGPVKALAGFINMMMRRGIPKHRHARTLPYYQDYRKYAAALALADPSKAYFFVLDRDGIIRWQDSGPVTAERLAGLMAVVVGLQRP
jgi:hypothetical protein